MLDGPRPAKRVQPRASADDETQARRGCEDGQKRGPGLGSVLLPTTYIGREAEKRCIMTGRTKAALVMLALLLLFPAVLWAEPPVGWQVTWNDYRTPLACVPVQYSQATIIWVYLPAEFLEGRSQVTLVYAVLSATMDSLDPRKMPTFNSCRPYLRIGEGMSSGIYDPSLDTDSAMLTIRLEVKTKHLRPGRNRIKAMCDSPPGIFCAADECRFYITKMYFKEAVASEEGGSQGKNRTSLVNGPGAASRK